MRPKQLARLKLSLTNLSLKGKYKVQGALANEGSKKYILYSAGSRREETWVEALQRIRSQGQHAESRLTKSAEFGHMSDPLTGGGRIWKPWNIFIMTYELWSIYLLKVPNCHRKLMMAAQQTGTVPLGRPAPQRGLQQKHHNYYTLFLIIMLSLLLLGLNKKNQSYSVNLNLLLSWFISESWKFCFSLLHWERLNSATDVSHEPILVPVDYLAHFKCKCCP